MGPTIYFQRNINSLLLTLLLLFGILSSCDSPSKTEEVSPEQEIVVQTKWKPDNAINEEVRKQEQSNLKSEPSKWEDDDDPFFDNPEIYAVQVGSFINRSNADKLFKDLTNKGYTTKIIVSDSKGKQWNIVRLGPFSNKSSAVKIANEICKKEKLDSIIFLNSKIIKNVSAKKENLKKVKKLKLTRSKSTPDSTPKIKSNEKAKTAIAKNIQGNKRQIKYDKKAKYSFQVGGLNTQSIALKHKTRLKKKGYPAFTVKEKGKANNDTWYSVRIGYFKTIKDAVNAAARFTDKEEIPAQARPISD